MRTELKIVWLATAGILFGAYLHAKLIIKWVEQQPERAKQIIEYEYKREL
jgi:hypothetical protein